METVKEDHPCECVDSLVGDVGDAFKFGQLSLDLNVHQPKDGVDFHQFILNDPSDHPRHPAKDPAFGRSDFGHDRLGVGVNHVQQRLVKLAVGKTNSSHTCLWTHRHILQFLFQCSTSTLYNSRELDANVAPCYVSG